MTRMVGPPPIIVEITIHRVSHVFASISKIKSRNMKVPLSVSPLPQQLFTRGPIVTIGITIDLRGIDPGGYIFSNFFHLPDKVKL